MILKGKEREMEEREQNRKRRSNADDERKTYVRENIYKEKRKNGEK